MSRLRKNDTPNNNPNNNHKPKVFNYYTTPTVQRQKQIPISKVRYDKKPRSYERTNDEVATFYQEPPNLTRRQQRFGYSGSRVAKGKKGASLHPYFQHGTSGGSEARKYFKIPEGDSASLKIFAREGCDCSHFVVRSRLLNDTEKTVEGDYQRRASQALANDFEPIDKDVADLMKNNEGEDTERVKSGKDNQGNTIYENRSFKVRTGEIKVQTLNNTTASVRDAMFVIEIIDTNNNEMCSKIIIWIDDEKQRKEAVDDYNNKELREKEQAEAAEKQAKELADKQEREEKATLALKIQLEKQQVETNKMKEELEKAKAELEAKRLEAEKAEAEAEAKRVAAENERLAAEQAEAEAEADRKKAEEAERVALAAAAAAKLEADKAAEEKKALAEAERLTAEAAKAAADAAKNDSGSDSDEEETVAKNEPATEGTEEEEGPKEEKATPPPDKEENEDEGSDNEDKEETPLENKPEDQGKPTTTEQDSTEKDSTEQDSTEQDSTEQDSTEEEASTEDNGDKQKDSTEEEEEEEPKKEEEAQKENENNPPSVDNSDNGGENGGNNDADNSGDNNDADDNNDTADNTEKPPDEEETKKEKLLKTVGNMNPIQIQHMSSIIKTNNKKDRKLIGRVQYVMKELNLNEQELVESGLLEMIVDSLN